jgi:hypothetical protein
VKRLVDIYKGGELESCDVTIGVEASPGLTWSVCVEKGWKRERRLKIWKPGRVAVPYGPYVEL